MKRTRRIREYPRQFWILVLCTFIDRIGMGIMCPFLMLYVTRKFDVSIAQAGVFLGLFSLADAVGRVLGGALTDRLGRKLMLILGLAASASTSLLMGWANSIELFYGSALIVGLFASTGTPAQQAMVADLLPEERRSGGFGIIRVAFNLGVAIGAALGGLLAARSYTLLFISDAAISLLTAGIVILMMHETRPVPGRAGPAQPTARASGGYLDVLRDVTFMLFIAANVAMMCMYRQSNTTLSVYLRDVHSVSEQGLGILTSFNAALVILFQFPISRLTDRYRPLIVIAAGTVLFALGFSMYAWVSTYVLFMVATTIITVGEMFVAPTAQAVAAQLSPEDKRGRYMGVFGFSWTISTAIGPFLAGLIMDHADPRWVWYAVGLAGLMAAGGFALLQRRVERSTRCEEALGESDVTVERNVV
jgi:MFS family permease